MINNADPQVDLEFAVTNGNLAASTVFDITAATIVFTAVPNAEAAALASVSLTQGAGSPAGVSASGLFAGDKMYEARYSTHPVANTHTVFADLVSGFSAAFGDTRTEGLPEIGMVALGTTVYMMESEFKFSLSAGDQASGTSVFLITPEPASLVLMGLASALLFRNRRGG